MPVVTCPHCRTPVDIHPDDAGYKVLCPSCHSAFQAGDTERPLPAPVSPPPPSPPPLSKRVPAEPETVTTRCTICEGQVRIAVDDLGHLMECPLCGEKFRPVLERSDSGSTRRVPSHYAREDPRDDDDDEDDFDDRRSRRQRYREEDKDYILDTARAAIAWPANGLLWTGIVMLVLYLLIGFGTVFFGISQQDAPRPYQRNEGVTFIFIGFAIAIFGGVHGFIIALSGHLMKKLRGTLWGYLGASFAIATLVLSLPCAPTTWAAVTFGIWAIVTMSKREVQDAIRINTGRME